MSNTHIKFHQAIPEGLNTRYAIQPVMDRIFSSFNAKYFMFNTKWCV